MIRVVAGAVAAAVVAVVAAIAFAGAPVHASSEPPDPPGTVADNPFVPEDRNLSDCISALPPPDCGSDARGGWRQALVLGLVVAGGAFIAWRVVRSRRRTDEAAGSHREREDVP